MPGRQTSWTYTAMTAKLRLMTAYAVERGHFLRTVHDREKTLPKTKPNQQQNLTDRTPNAVCHRHVSPASKLHLEIVLLSMIIRGLYPASSSRPNQPQFITNPDKWELYSDRKSRQSGADLFRYSCRPALTDYDRPITTELRAHL